MGNISTKKGTLRFWRASSLHAFRFEYNCRNEGLVSMPYGRLFM